MDWQKDQHPPYLLASLLAATAPARPRPEHGLRLDSQNTAPVNFPLSNVREHPPFNASPRNMRYVVPHDENAHQMRMLSVNTYAPPHGYPPPGSFAPHYQAYPSVTAPAYSYNARRYEAYPQQVAPPTRESNHAVARGPFHKPSATPDAEPEEPTQDEKPVRRLRRSRKKRKQTPILVFDDDSEDGDYKDTSAQNKRTKYDYDSEGAIDAKDGFSSSEEVQEPEDLEEAEEAEEVDEAVEVEEVEEPAEPKPKPKK